MSPTGKLGQCAQEIEEKRLVLRHRPAADRPRCILQDIGRDRAHHEAPNNSRAASCNAARRFDKVRLWIIRTAKAEATLLIGVHYVV